MKIRVWRHYSLLLVVFVVAFILSNIAATKLVLVGPLMLDGGVILFPIVYIVGDIITEVYGYRMARRTLWIGFFMMLMTIGVMTIVRFLPYPESYTDQSSFDAIFGFLPRIVAASLLAYIVGGFVNSYILAKMKVVMKGRRLWARLVGSSVVGEMFDTVVFCLVAFGGIISGAEMVNYIVVGWACKVAAEIVLLPVVYRVIAWLKKSERANIYDKDTNFSPFIMD